MPGHVMVPGIPAHVVLQGIPGHVVVPLTLGSGWQARGLCMDGCTVLALAPDFEDGLQHVQLDGNHIQSDP